MSQWMDKARSVLEELSVEKPTDLDGLEQFRIKYIGSKGLLKELSGRFQEIPNEHKKDFGQLINQIKNKAEEKVKELRASMADSASSADLEMDLTAPGRINELGSRHPVNLVRDRMIEIFGKMGYTVAEGPEIEDDWHNFTALNTPADHPARDMQDTFYLTEDQNYLLRTHTSPVQIRTMEQEKPPIRIITPGRVYRNETISSRSHCTFHQVEGLYIDEGVSFAELKQTIYHFVTEMFGKEKKLRFRPSYFPFTEPSAEVDVYWGLETDADRQITKGTGWLEVLGCGMVDPEVLKNCNIDPEKYSGFAFGIGIDRIAMNRFNVTDIRALFENDLRMLKQFGSAF